MTIQTIHLPCIYATRIIIPQVRFYSGGNYDCTINNVLSVRRVPSRALTPLNFNISPYFPTQTYTYLLPSNTLLAQYTPTASHRKNQYESTHTHCHISSNDTIMPIDNTISLIFMALHSFNKPINSGDIRQNSQ